MTYTPEELREEGNAYVGAADTYGAYPKTSDEYRRVGEMLRYAAELAERQEKALKECEKAKADDWAHFWNVAAILRGQS